MIANTPTIPRRVWLEVDLATLRANYLKIAHAVAPCGVIAVLKANAYGLGVQPIARALAEAGVAGFGVAEPYEALSLLDLKRPVQILGSVMPDEIAALIAADVILPITDLVSAEGINAEAARQRRRARVHLKIDTGMGRLGILLHDAPRVVRAVVRLPHLDCEGIYSHFPVAYRTGGDYTNRQIDGFTALLDQLARDGIVFAKRHIANSDAINNFPRTLQPPFNFVRTGINLHGSFDTDGMRTLQVRPVLTLKTRLTAVRDLPAGTHIGYGLTYRLPHASRVGTVSAGYADGLPLALSNRGHVLIRDTPCPVLGRLSMDYTTVSLEQVPDARVGDEVICLGGSGPQAVQVEDWAQLKATHAYEIICSLGSRVERRYLDGATSSKTGTDAAVQ
jgi:alanine racemase